MERPGGCLQDLRRLLGRRVSLPGETANHGDRDWDRMLRRLRRSYNELLDQSLHDIAWMDLDLSTKPEAVSNVTNLLFRLPDGDERLLAPSTRMLDTYDEAEGELLILGAPGAGKSTLLADPDHPLPFIHRHLQDYFADAAVLPPEP
jgi:ABC-type uncharacterized transport system fused permease/ATPase subunit